MSNELTKYSPNHTTQFNNLGQDLRFYADQRFKVFTVFVVATGFIANLANSRPSLMLGIAGIIFSYLCLSWEKRTTQWWAILYEGLKSIEAMAVSEETMVHVYQSYPKKSRAPFVKARHAIEGIYYIVIIGWCLYLYKSWPVVW